MNINEIHGDNILSQLQICVFLGEEKVINIVVYWCIIVLAFTSNFPYFFFKTSKMMYSRMTNTNVC